MYVIFYLDRVVPLANACYCITEESLELILTLINILLVVIPLENLFQNTNIIKNTFKNVNI